MVPRRSWDAVGRHAKHRESLSVALDPQQIADPCTHHAVHARGASDVGDVVLVSNRVPHHDLRRLKARGSPAAAATPSHVARARHRAARGARRSWSRRVHHRGAWEKGDADHDSDASSRLDLRRGSRLLDHGEARRLC